MSSSPPRFIHASDLHLEQPPHGIADVPSQLKERLVEAAYAAAEQVFLAACQQQVDFLVLSGDVMDLEAAAPCDFAFLLDQFERLAKRNIAIYWSAGPADPPRCWPAAVPIPDNVHVFPAGRIETVVHERDGRPVARVMGVSRGPSGKVPLKQFEPDPGGLFTVAVAHGDLQAASLEGQHVDYLALGGRHSRRTLRSGRHTCHWPGTPQGRCPSEQGPHGCTLVEVDDQGQVQARPIPTDVVRWHHERVALAAETTHEDLKAMLHERLESLRADAGDRDLIIHWTVEGAGRLASRLCGGTAAADLLTWLQAEYGTGPPAAWSTRLAAEPTDGLPADWYEEETILGEFLRLLRSHERDADLPLELDAYLSDRHLAGSIGSAARLSDKRRRERVLRQAAQLGAELLGGQTPEAQA